MSKFYLCHHYRCSMKLKKRKKLLGRKESNVQNHFKGFVKSLMVDLGFRRPLLIQAFHVKKNVMCRLYINEDFQ